MSEIKRIHKPLKLMRQEEGAALLVSLVMLLLLTIIGLSAVNLTTMDTRISANMKDRSMAFDAAETALNIAGDTIEPGTPTPDSSTAGMLSSSMADNWWKSADETWWTNNSEAVSDFSGRKNSTNGISYVIEQPIEIDSNGANQQVNDLGMGGIKPVTRFYRITSRGRGPGGADVNLQSVYARKVYNNAVN
ncbi:PilX N-terminal domain-containing pilus assembly protein [Marinobacter sp. NFXS9]|uniref:pilus assembly PilX family protein n=1 Tax=Marinobacter sp. NFXS9 TaxID=2818433 RepID=UPI0032E02491